MSTPAATSLPSSRRNRSWFSRCLQRGGCVLAACLALSGAATPGTGGEVSKEYQLKAAYLYNFTKFVEWPPARFADASSPVVIGLLGPNPFGDELVKIVAGRKAGSRDIVVKQLTSAGEAGEVQVLFISAAVNRPIEDLLVALQTAGTLTVGETPQFTAAGGIITFALETDKVRFEINQAASEQAGLKISAQLLKLATAVHRKPGAP